MPISLRKNGVSPKTDIERMASIRERIRTELGRSSENAEILRLQLIERVKKYERRYEMQSVDMMEQLRKKQIRETRDIIAWGWAWQTLAMLGDETRMTGIH